MHLAQEQLYALARQAITAAKKAGKHIAEHAGQEIAVDKKTKENNLAAQVVTEVDRQSQSIILELITPTLVPYDLGLLAEESVDDGSRFEKDYFWCIDPLDGTLPFIEGRPGYAVSIALVSREAIAYIGVIYDPRKHTLYHAIRGVGAFRNETAWDVNLNATEPYEEIDCGGAVMNACCVLENPSRFYCKHPKPENGGGCVWDYAATTCLYQALGAWATDIYGDPLELNRKEAPYMNHKGVLYAANEDVARERIKSR